jgi:hypothetical protein
MPMGARWNGRIPSILAPGRSCMLRLRSTSSPGALNYNCCFVWSTIGRYPNLLLCPCTFLLADLVSREDLRARPMVHHDNCFFKTRNSNPNFKCCRLDFRLGCPRSRVLPQHYFEVRFGSSIRTLPPCIVFGFDFMKDAQRDLVLSIVVPFALQTQLLINLLFLLLICYHPFHAQNRINPRLFSLYDSLNPFPLPHSMQTPGSSPLPDDALALLCPRCHSRFTSRMPPRKRLADSAFTVANSEQLKAMESGFRCDAAHFMVFEAHPANQRTTSRQ